MVLFRTKILFTLTYYGSFAFIDWFHLDHAYGLKKETRNQSR
jgi:hypothetical protein